MRSFGFVGQSAETLSLSDTYTPAAGEVEMAGPRPSPAHVAQADGTWALPAVTAAEVKTEAARRLATTDWYVIRAAEGGAAVPEAVTAYRAAVRAASGEIEACDPIPADYADDSYWPAVVL